MKIILDHGARGLGVGGLGLMAKGRLLALAGSLFVLAAATPRAQQTPPDLILSNGKIVTVDERFTIAQAVAVRGDRIVAVGSNADIGKLAGAGTRRIDLAGRTVTPGLIDNHMHLLRGGHHLGQGAAVRRRRVAQAGD